MQKKNTHKNENRKVKKTTIKRCYYGRQEQPAILISRLLLRMRRVQYVPSIRLDFH